MPIVFTQRNILFMNAGANDHRGTRSNLCQPSDAGTKTTCAGREMAAVAKEEKGQHRRAIAPDCRMRNAPADNAFTIEIIVQ